MQFIFLGSHKNKFSELFNFGYYWEAMCTVLLPKSVTKAKCTGSVHWCTEFSALVHRIFNLWTMLFNQLPDDVILRIFSFISFHLIRRTISLVCKKWNRTSEDPSLVGLDQESSQTYSALLEQRLNAFAFLSKASRSCRSWEFWCSVWKQYLSAFCWSLIF